MARTTGIMFITTSLHPGGMACALLNLARGLAAEGKYAPAVACFQKAGAPAKEFEASRIPIYDEILKEKHDLFIVSRLRGLMNQNQTKIVVLVGSGRNCTVWGALAAKAAGAKIVVWSHTFSQPGHPEFERSGRLLYPLVDRFIALGKRHKACMAWRDKIPAGKIAIIPNGIQPDLYHGHAHWRDRARAILGLADENILAVGMIAGLRPGKRHDVFIEAARQVVGRYRDIHFFIIGDGANQSNVRAWAQKSELLGSYLSLLGHRDDLPQLLHGLDLVCVCSEFQDCQSLAALEAMACGVPVVSNFIGSMDEAIADNETGFFYHPLSPNALAERLFETALKPMLRQAVGQTARTRIEQRFTAKRMVGDFTGLFDSLLTAHHRPTGRLGFVRRVLPPDQIDSIM